MTILPLSESSIAIFLEPSELEYTGVSTQSFDADAASPLVHSALAEAGIALDGNLEIEAFSNSEGVLMFARVIPQKPAFCVFDRLEELIMAATSIHDAPADSSLTYLEGKYWLTLFGAARMLEAQLSEFSEKQELDSTFIRHLAEHGRTLIPQRALNRLSEYFA